MSAPRRFWIAALTISPAIEAKLRERRGLTGEQVRRAVIPDSYLSARWEDHPMHGRRLLVIADTDDGRRLKVVLQPDEHDAEVWRLRTVLVMMKP